MWQSEQNRRLTIFGWIIVTVIALLVLRLAWMQLLHGPQYKKQADQNRVRQLIEYAPRGEIFDRNGAVLVSNRPSFAVSIIPAEFSNREPAIEFLATTTGTPQDLIREKLTTGLKNPYTPVRIKHDLDAAALAKIEERKNDFPGIIIEAVAIRHYVYSQLAAHLFGHIGTINEQEYAQRKNKGYLPQDMIGKTGLERLWEDRLRGAYGGSQVEINAAGEELRKIGYTPTTPGHGLSLFLDANLQKAAEAALAAQVLASRKIGEPAKGGAAIVLDVRTGGVLALASNPSYDPNIFADGLNDREWNKILNNPDQPLNNRAVSGVYPPASVFKIVTVAAALETGLTTSDEIFEDKGVYMLDGWKFHGWKKEGLGKLTVSDALAWSSDPVFYELGKRIGIDNLASYAVTFGFGQPTGIGLPEESGLVPTKEWKSTRYNEPWYPGETLNAAIGQGYLLATPLQQTLLLMAVANGGVIYRPMLVRNILAPDGTVIETLQPEVSQTVFLRPETWATIRKGLLAVTTKGTASVVFKGFPYQVAGKTGSAETGRKATHAWFACYAPADSPEIAVLAFVEDGGEGSIAAAPVVRKVLEAYFNIPSTGQPSTPPKGSTD